MAIINFSDTVETIVRDFAQLTRPNWLKQAVWDSLSDNQKKRMMAYSSFNEARKDLESWGKIGGKSDKKDDKGKGGSSNSANDFYHGDKTGESREEKQNRKDANAEAEGARRDYWANQRTYQAWEHADKDEARTKKKTYQEKGHFRVNLENEDSWINRFARYGNPNDWTGYSNVGYVEDPETGKVKVVRGKEVWDSKTSEDLRAGRIGTVEAGISKLTDAFYGVGRAARDIDTNLFGPTRWVEDTPIGTGRKDSEGNEITKKVIKGAAGKKSERLRNRADWYEKKGREVGRSINDSARNLRKTGNTLESILKSSSITPENKESADRIANQAYADIRNSVILGQLGQGVRKAGNVRAEYLRDKADLKDADAHAQARFNKIYKTKNLVTDTFGSIKDSVSEKSRAKTLAERGTVGVRRRDARLAYALGDRSLMTKMYSGHLGGNNPILNRAGRLISNHFRNEEFRNRANYARGISFSELGGIMADLGSKDFDEEVFPPAGEGWQYEEYPMLYNILHDDKYEKFDQKVLQEGQFSENEGEVNSNETPVDGRVIDSDSLRPATNHEQTVEDLLTKNYYDVPFIEKKFQEMIARGFAEESEETEATPYEKFLNDFSDRAESVRRI